MKVLYLSWDLENSARRVRASSSSWFSRSSRCFILIVIWSATAWEYALKGEATCICGQEGRRRDGEPRQRRGWAQTHMRFFTSRSFSLRTNSSSMRSLPLCTRVCLSSSKSCWVWRGGRVGPSAGAEPATSGSLRTRKATNSQLELALLLPRLLQDESHHLGDLALGLGLVHGFKNERRAVTVVLLAVIR